MCRATTDGTFQYIFDKGSSQVIVFIAQPFFKVGVGDGGSLDLESTP